MTEAGWTREKPTAAGWYWWRRDNTKKPRCVRVREFGGRLVVWDIPDDMEKAFDDMKPCGEWLGPITPGSYQQGRVAGYQEGLSEAIRVANEDGNILAVRQVLNWMAQQAQDDQLAKGEQ